MELSLTSLSLSVMVPLSLWFFLMWFCSYSLFPKYVPQISQDGQCLWLLLMCLIISYLFWHWNSHWSQFFRLFTLFDLSEDVLVGLFSILTTTITISSMLDCFPFWISSWRIVIWPAICSIKTFSWPTSSFRAITSFSWLSIVSFTSNPGVSSFLCLYAHFLSNRHALSF